MNAVCKEWSFVELPEEIHREGYCAQLKFGCTACVQLPAPGKKNIRVSCKKMDIVEVGPFQRCSITKRKR